MAILVCGVESEPPVKLLIEKLKESGLNFILMNQQDLAESVRLRWQLTKKGIEGNIYIGNENIDIREIKGVFLRFMSIEKMPIAKDNPQIIGKTRSIIYGLNDLFDVIPAKIINRRRAMMSNNSKPYQSLFIREAGFSIPKTIVTNSPNNAKKFFENNNSVIYKSVSSVRSIVKTFENDDIEQLFKVRLLPTQFQEKIEGFNVRVHVVAEKTFATRINSGSTDYRYAHNDGECITLEEFQLSDDLKKRCVNLTKKLGLLFAGIDLMINDKNVYCLEVNTSPAYSFYQSWTDQPIAEELANLLSS